MFPVLSPPSAPRPNAWVRPFLWGVIGLGAIVIGAGIVASQHPAPQTTSGSPAVTPSGDGSSSGSASGGSSSGDQAAGSYSDGTYQVGTDIQPGLYHTAGGAGCYWARLRSADTSDPSSIIANDNVSGPVTVRIKSTDGAFETTNCGAWSSLADAGAPDRFPSSFGDGAYEVGMDIGPGTYRTAGGDGCYWARSSDLGWATSALIANDNAAGPAVVTISPPDAGFKTQGCGTWMTAGTLLPGGKAGASSFGDGTWVVGVDVAPGVYGTNGQDGCYYELLRGFGGTMEDIISNDNPTSNATITLDASVLGVKSKGCGTWSLLGHD